MRLEVISKYPLEKRHPSPLLVLGAANDRLFTVPEQQNTARAYNTDAVIYPNMAHHMMLERGWETVADRILEWLNSRNL